MPIYCDCEKCSYCEDGVCWADKLYLDNNGVCMSIRYNREEEDENE